MSMRELETPIDIDLTRRVDNVAAGLGRDEYELLLMQKLDPPSGAVDAGLKRCEISAFIDQLASLACIQLQTDSG